MFREPQGKKKTHPAVIAVFYFNKKCRTFHSHLIWGREAWEKKKKTHYKEQLKKIRRDIEEDINSANLTKHPPRNQSTDERVIRKIGNETVEHWSDDDLYLSERVLMQAYCHLPSSTDEFLSGLLYSAISGYDGTKLSDEIRSKLAFLVVDINDSDATNGYPTDMRPWIWSRVDFKSVTSGFLSQCPQLLKPSESRPLTNIRRRIWGKLLKHFYWERLTNYLKAHAIGNSTGGRHALLVPVFDTWDEGRGYGGLWGVLVCSFANDEGRKSYLAGDNKKRLHDLLLEIERLSDEYFAAGLTKIAWEQIVPPYDWIELFVKRIHWIQDWERVTVLNHSEKYCYRHSPPAANNIEWKWDRCKEEDPDRCVSCRNEKGKRIFKWSDVNKDLDDVHPILNEDLIKELGQEEKSAFGGIDIEFEFPASAVVPDEKAKNKRHINFAIARQHIAALRTLLPIVRNRRAALRSAVSAIMGRNMSHNIGSHVLACYSSAIKNDLDPANKDNTDHRTDFLSYIQRRMDFLAEVATSDRAFWEQPLSLDETINKLNLKEQQERIKADDPCSATCSQSSATPATLSCSRLKTPAGAKKNEPILLSYITGKESLTASVEWGNPADTGDEKPSVDALYFSCPGGEVGVHALYVILENIIRNSARHAKSNGDESVNVYVSVSEAPDAKDNLIQLTIIDPRTMLDKDGWVMETGKRVGDKSLTAHINEILTKEPFLNKDGSANPKYWGVREMQICAHYLRGLPLGDLEGEAELPRVLEANPWGHVKDGVNGCCLSYTLYLKRAQLLAYIEAPSKSENNNEERDKRLLSRGIKPICRDKVENGDEGIDWRKIANESRGYSFLAMPPDLMGEYKKKLDTDASLKYALPVRTIEMDVDKELIEKTDGDTALSWMQPLHETMIEKYRNNGQEKNGQAQTKIERWGKGNVYAVVGWDRKEIPAQEAKKSERIHVSHVLLNSSTNVKPFSTMPEELPLSNVHNHVGLAWLDHPNDTVLGLGCLGSATPAAASLNVGRRSVNWASVEPMWSDSPHTQILVKAMQNDRSEGMPELAAAAFARVVVLDERIQSRRHDKVREVTLYKYWPRTGIWCPLHPKDVEIQEPIVGEEHAYHDSAKACDLDEPIFEDIQKFLKQPTKLDYQLPTDFLVLHLTILERLNKDCHKERPEESINKTLTELVRGTQCEHAQIIIVTGRGVPTAARHRDEDGRVDARYLPISALQEFLVIRPSKLGLMRALWAAAAPGN